MLRGSEAVERRLLGVRVCSFFVVGLCLPLLLLSPGALGQIGGSLSCRVAYHAAPGVWTFEGELNLAWSLTANIQIASITGLSTTGLNSQAFNATTSVDIWSFYTDVRFSPATATWDQATFGVMLDLPRANLQTRLRLFSVPSSSSLVSRLSVKAGDVPIQLAVRSDLLPLAFRSAMIRIASLQLPQLGSVGGVLEITKEGFSYLELTGGVPVAFCGSPLSIGLTVRFSVDATELSTKLGWEPTSDSECIKVFARMRQTGGAEGLQISGIEVHGLRLRCKLGGVRLTSATAFDPEWASEVIGVSKPGYFELIELAGNLVGCCGADGSWYARAYFAEEGGLFGVAEVQLGMSHKASGALVLDLGVIILWDAPGEVTLGVKISW